MKIKTKTLLMAGGTWVIIATTGTALWWHFFHHYTPIEVAQDIRAGIMSRYAGRPVEKYLELRYGPMTDPANRQKAFLDFFNAGHIEGLHVLTTHMDGGEQKTNVLDMAQWLAQYRETMTLEEKQSLKAYFASPDGRATLRNASGKYLQSDAHYRAATSPVITELMKTLTAIQH